MDLRRELGDNAYDRYLFNTGVPNRVRVTSVMQGSAAHDAGLLPGDVIEAYDRLQIYDGRELREATTAGIRDESVPVVIRRGEIVLDAWLPRGPIGISLERVRVMP
jgi:S1-C subfamily serine protease